MESPFKKTLERLKNDPRERVAKAVRRAEWACNHALDEPAPDDLWENEDHTPEWARDDCRAVADAAMAELNEIRKALEGGYFAAALEVAAEAWLGELNIAELYVNGNANAAALASVLQRWLATRGKGPLVAPEGL